MRTSGVNPTSADRRRHLGRRVVGPTLPQRELGQRRLHRADELDVRGTLRQRRQGTQALGGLGEPAARHREAAEQLLLEDLVDPERPDVGHAAKGVLAGIPAPEPVLVFGDAAEQVRAEEPHQAEPFRRANTDPCRLDGVLQPARDIEDEDEVGVRAADVVDAADLLGDLERDAQVLDRLVVSPSVPRPIPRVLSAWPSTSRAPTARAAASASFAQSSTPRTWRPASGSGPGPPSPGRAPRTAARPGSGARPPGRPPSPPCPGPRSRRSARGAR